MARSENRRGASALGEELHHLLQRIAVKGGDQAPSAYSAPSVHPPRPISKEDCRKLLLAGCTQLNAATDHFAVTHGLLPKPSLGEPHAEIPVHAKELLCSFLDEFDWPNNTEMLMLTKALRVPKATIEKFVL